MRRWLFLNPPYIFIRSIRQLVLEQQLPAIYDWIIMSLWLGCVVWIGTIVHKKLQSEVKDIL
jgi:lipopolysaccharide transport system permease protein